MSELITELIFHQSVSGLSKDILLVALLENFCRENGDNRLNAFKKITASLCNNNVITSTILKKSAAKSMSLLKNRCIEHLLNVINSESTYNDTSYNHTSNEDAMNCALMCPVESYIYNMLTKKTESTYHSFECIDEIGYGGSSSVYKVKSIIDHKSYALKQVPLTDNNLKYVRESIILSNMEHKNIIRYSTSWIDKDYFSKFKHDKKWLSKTVGERIYLYIQMELCDLALTDINTMKLHPDVKHNIYSQILQGVRYIHSIDYVHRDIKPKNIMLKVNNVRSNTGENMSYTVKICDFGVATYVGGVEQNVNYTKNISPVAFGSTTIGTELYIDDDLKETSMYNTDKRIDIYPLGIIYFEMLIDYNTEMERIRSIEELKKGNYGCVNDKQRHFIGKLIAPILNRSYINDVLRAYHELMN